MTPIPTATVAPLELIPAIAASGEGDAVMPVRWCVPPSMLAALKAAGAHSAQVFLLATHESGFEQRWVVPLEREMAYIQFDRPGKHTLRGVVLYPEHGKSAKHVRTNLLRHGYGGFTYQVDYEGSLRFDTTIGVLTTAVERLTVFVPERFFAKPNKALHAFANMPFSAHGRPVDQCAFRKRLIFTSLATLVTAAAIAIIVWLLTLITPGLFRWFGQHGLTVLLFVGTVVAAAAFFTAGFVMFNSDRAQRHIGALNIGLNNRFIAWRNARRVRKYGLWMDTLDEITCSNEVKRAELAALAPKRRTFSLRFRALKSKVCRPYAR